MPIEPGKKETEQEFMARCVPIEVAAGNKQDQAVAICYSKWRARSKKEMDISSSIEKKVIE
jgi:hypothetical protein